MHFSLIALSAASAAASIVSGQSCTYHPTPASLTPFKPVSGAPYDTATLAVPTADSCITPYFTGAQTEQIKCVRTYIDSLDAQLAFLVARRMQFAAVAGLAKLSLGADLDNAARDEAVKESLGGVVEVYGAPKEAGVQVAQTLVAASLAFEKQVVAESCKAA